MSSRVPESAGTIREMFVIDHNLSDSVRLMGRYSISDSESVPSPTFLTQGNPSNYPSDGRQQNAAFSYLHTFSPSVINEVRAGVNRVYSQDTSPTLGQDFPALLGIPGVPQDNFPRINITGFSSIGNDRSRPALARVTSFQLLDNVTIIKGKHYLKVGFDFRRSYSNNYNPTNASGEFSFGPLQTGISTNNRTGNAFASFVLGQGSGFQLLPGVSSYLSFPSNDFYVQDDIKISPRLTLNLGARYEPAFHWVENTTASRNSIRSADRWTSPASMAIRGISIRMIGITSGRASDSHTV